MIPGTNYSVRPAQHLIYNTDCSLLVDPKAFFYRYVRRFNYLSDDIIYPTGTYNDLYKPKHDEKGVRTCLAPIRMI